MLDGMEGRSRWTDDRLDDALIPLRGVPVAVSELQVTTRNLTRALDANTASQRERNRIVVAFLSMMVVGLIAAVVTLIVAL